MSSEAASFSGNGETVVSVTGLGKFFAVYSKPLDRLKQTLFRGRRQFYTPFWALKDVSFELRAGESLGIIGRNGAGKSTLLQIIAGTMEPTEGEVEVGRRVAALLELGSGFNFEFTGRENVWLNCVILGVPEGEIERRFPEIEAFAGIGEFLDRPVKTYSTGMVVRLAFAVQVLLDPEILIVDEALAVGDAAFQIKCMDHMRGLLERGVSVILVTHDVNTVRSFCDRVLWLDAGRVEGFGEPREITSRYMERTVEDVAAGGSESAESESDEKSDVAFGLPALTENPDYNRWGDGWARVEGVGVFSGDHQQALVLEHGEPMRIEAECVFLEDTGERNLSLAFAIKNTNGLDIICYATWEAGDILPAGKPGERRRFAFELENILAPGKYVLTMAIEDVQGVERRYGDFVENAALITVVSKHAIYSSVLPRIQHTIVSLTPR